MLKISSFVAIAAMCLAVACKKDDKSKTTKDDVANKTTDGAGKTDKTDEKSARIGKKTPETAIDIPAAPPAQPFDATAIYDLPVKTLDGKPSKVGDHKGKALLIVNVASKCGLTPQYAELEALQKKHGGKGFTVLGFPCNQFGGQEPGSSEEIAEFCSKTYGVTFPMFEKVEVNGDGRHPVYKELTKIKDGKGEAGDIKWNFEKFVISADGKSIHRFRPRTKPNAPELLAAIKAGMPVAN